MLITFTVELRCDLPISPKGNDQLLIGSHITTLLDVIRINLNHEQGNKCNIDMFWAKYFLKNDIRLTIDIVDSQLKTITFGRGYKGKLFDKFYTGMSMIEALKLDTHIYFSRENSAFMFKGFGNIFLFVNDFSFFGYTPEDIFTGIRDSTINFIEITNEQDDNVSGIHDSNPLNSSAMSTGELTDKPESIVYSMEVKTREDFIRFLDLLLEDYQRSTNEWENNSLPSYLSALSAYSEDVDGYYHNFNIPFDPTTVSWGIFADLLRGAVVYE